MRLIIEDVTLIKAKDITVKVRFKGGATRTLDVPAPKWSWETWKTPEPIVREVDRPLEVFYYILKSLPYLLSKAGTTTKSGGLRY
ncbi:MAG: hypothetical protein ACMUIU_09055 [bacterium]